MKEKEYKKNRQENQEQGMQAEEAHIFLTGATGLVGRGLIRRLVSLPVPIHLILLVRDKKRAEQMMEAMSGAAGEEKREEEMLAGGSREEAGEHTQIPRITLIQGDVTEEISVDGPIDLIIHGASVTKSSEMTARPVETFLTCVDGTRRVLELAREKKVRSMVYLSSMEMYGTFGMCGSEAFGADRSGGRAKESCSRDGRKPGSGNQGGDLIERGDITEDMLGYLNLSEARTSYPEGKRGAELLCAAYYREYQVPVKIARLSQTFGAGVSPEEGRVFAQFARSAMAGSDIILHTDGSSEGNYCSLADTVEGILTILKSGRDGEAYNIANEALHMTIAEMADLVASTVAPKVCGRRIGVVFDIPEQGNRYGYAQKTKLFLDAGKLRALGWKPRYGMREMYEQMIGEWGKPSAGCRKWCGK